MWFSRRCLAGCCGSAGRRTHSRVRRFGSFRRPVQGAVRRSAVLRQRVGEVSRSAFLAREAGCGSRSGRRCPRWVRCVGGLRRRPSGCVLREPGFGIVSRAWRWPGSNGSGRMVAAASGTQTPFGPARSPGFCGPAMRALRRLSGAGISRTAATGCSGRRYGSSQNYVVTTRLAEARRLHSRNSVILSQQSRGGAVRSRCRMPRTTLGNNRNTLRRRDANK